MGVGEREGKNDRTKQTFSKNRKWPFQLSNYHKDHVKKKIIYVFFYNTKQK